MNIENISEYFQYIYIAVYTIFNSGEILEAQMQTSNFMKKIFMRENRETHINIYNISVCSKNNNLFYFISYQCV